MKKFSSLLYLFMVFLAVSCSSDDNDNVNTSAGELIVNGESYPLTKGFLIPNPNPLENPDGNPRRFYFVLTNGDVSYEDDDFVFSDNITQLVDFNMYTSEAHPGSVESTTYEQYHPETGFDTSQAYIDFAGINTDVVIHNQQYVSSTTFGTDDMDGQATISKSGNTYTITFSFSNDDNVVTGHYTGPLTDLQ